MFLIYSFGFLSETCHIQLSPFKEQIHTLKSLFLKTSLISIRSLCDLCGAKMFVELKYSLNQSKVMFLQYAQYTSIIYLDIKQTTVYAI